MSKRSRNGIRTTAKTQWLFAVPCRELCPWTRLRGAAATLKMPLRPPSLRLFTSASRRVHLPVTRPALVVFQALRFASSDIPPVEP